MRVPGRLLLAAGVMTALACGVPEQKYKAALADAENATRDGGDQRRRADSCEERLKQEVERSALEAKRGRDLSDRLAELEKAASAATADAARQRELATQLAKTRELLEAEKAAASAEAERQRLLATRLEQEKTALERKSAEYEALASSLDNEIKAGRIQISELKGKVTVRMSERVLFPSGSATVSRAGRETLEKIADAFKAVKGRIIRVEGHTDNVPIRTARFPSNWELSSARAIAVVRMLQERGVDPTLLGAAGYAEYQPIATNDTPEGRAQNRRIESASLRLPGMFRQHRLGTGTRPDAARLWCGAVAEMRRRKSRSGDRSRSAFPRHATLNPGARARW
jgi:chemotaxis protein MotB